MANPIQKRTNAGHAIVLMIDLIRQLVLKIAKQGGGLMRTFWAWQVVEVSRAGSGLFPLRAKVWASE